MADDKFAPVAAHTETWNTCCSRTESSFVRYVAQLVVSLIALVFAVVMVSTGHTDPYYYGIITLVVGLFLPEPKHRPLPPPPPPNS